MKVTVRTFPSAVLCVIRAVVAVAVQVVGRNCRFLQGPDTDPAAVRAIHEAISHRLPVTVQLLNYTKSGKAFWNQLRLEPVFAPGDSERLLAYIGVQNDVTELVGGC